MPQPTKRPTVRDVARRAGVSAQSVSRVINNQSGVSDETRKHILRVMAELGYRPNRAAQTLASQRSQLLEVITMDIYYSGPFKEVVSAAARRRGYHVMFSEVTKSGFAHAVDSAAARSVDGLILIPSMPELDVSDAELIHMCNEIPFVQVATAVGAKVPSVVCDQQKGARLAVKHLIDLGHKHIAEISGPSNVLDAILRHDAWLSTLVEHGLTPGPSEIGGFRAGGGHAAMLRLLDSGEPFSGVFVGNDEMALGAMRALHERGLRVPQDVSVVGFDNIEQAPYFTPPLTTVIQDFHTMGELVVEYLIALIEKPDTPYYQRVLTPELVVRQSTCPAS